MAVRTFLHYALEVPDQTVGRRFYEDLDDIPEACAWEARDFPPEDSLYVSGPPCPADVGENKEAWT